MPYIDVDAAVVLFVNSVPLTDATDFKTRETAVAYNATGMDLVWNFVTTAGVVSQTAVTPTTTGDYDWTHVGDGMYSIEIPASGGASINNDAEGYGWFSGVCDGVLPWVSPIYTFRAAALNDADIDGGDVRDVNVTQWAGNTTEVTNFTTVFSTDFANNYSTDNDGWRTYPAGYYDQGEASNQAFPNNFATLVISSGGDLTTDITGNLSGSVGSVTGNVGGDVLGGINTGSGTITTLDALDNAQDLAHTATQASVLLVKAKTDNLPSDPADQSAVEAAITAATSGLATASSLSTVDGKIDDILEDTAEIGTAGAGLTEAGGTGDQFTAIIGADGDTLETLSDQLDGIPTTIRVKKNAALAGFPVVMLDTSGNPATEKTVTGTVSIDGAAFASLTNTISEVSGGLYTVDLAQADTNGNTLVMRFSATGCRTRFVEIVTQP